MRVCVTGGCGYIGSALVPKLLEEGHSVRVVDAIWFGNRLEPHANLETIEYDLRGGDPPVEGCAAVIHLAAIANDPCGDLHARLTWEVNALATVRLAQKCAKLGIRQIIFASSASIYGIKDNRPVTEDEPFEPVSDYNKTKLVGERALLSFSSDMNVQIVRPATVCGFSPRMRLDVIVNMLTAQAIEKGRITAHCGAHGGKLMRPHTHIDDLTDLYVWLLDRPHLKGPFNAGFENLSVGDLAEAIRGETGADVEFTEVADKRSYAVDSSSLRRAGFVPRSSVNDAIREMVLGWRAGKIKREPTSINLEWMRSQGIDQ